MKVQSDTEYFRERASVEREAAANAANEEIARLHEELARGFEVLADSTDTEAED